MNTAAPDALAPLGARRAARATLTAWRDAIRSLPPTAWRRAGLIALFGTVLQCALIVGERQPSIPVSALTPIFEAAAICWVVQVTLLLCAWAIVDRSGVATEKRAGRLAVALLLTVLVQAALVPALTGLLVGRLDPCVFHGCEDKDFSKVPSWLLQSEDNGKMLIFGSLIFALLEVNRRNRDIERRLLASQQERARLKRSAFDARLTAMRAQVDPQFLFDSLADVQSFYAIDTTRGAATLDLLITYLRTALPRLRTEGSTIGAEAELVAAWLAVIAARRNGLPVRRVEVESACANAPFPATVLLPLVQWAVGDAGQSACDVSLQVRPLQEDGARRLLVQLRVAPGRPCADDEPEPRRIRERLQAMYGAAVDLRCAWKPVHDGLDGGRSTPAAVITLRWPDESADRDRR
jgi:hypothetical protein